MECRNHPTNTRESGVLVVMKCDCDRFRTGTKTGSELGVKLGVKNPAQRAGLLKNFQPTLSSKTLEQCFVRYPLEAFASDISEFRPDDISSHKPHESFAKATGAPKITIWTGRRGRLNVSSPPKGRGFHVRFSERPMEILLPSGR